MVRKTDKWLPLRQHQEGTHIHTYACKYIYIHIYCTYTYICMGIHKNLFIYTLRTCVLHSDVTGMSHVFKDENTPGSLDGTRTQGQQPSMFPGSTGL